MYCKSYRALFTTTFLKGKSKCNLGICKGFFIGFYCQVIIVNQNKAMSKASFYVLIQLLINYNLKDIFLFNLLSNNLNNWLSDVYLLIFVQKAYSIMKKCPKCKSTLRRRMKREGISKYIYSLKGYDCKRCNARYIYIPVFNLSISI